VSALTKVSTSQWIIEGHSTTRAQALALVHAYLADELGLDEWDTEEAMTRVRVDRTYFSDTAGFVYAGYEPDGRAVVLVTGLPPTPGDPEPDATAPALEEA
jgi:hypothetical protein